MKVCGYCGRENEDNAARCDECGWPMPKVNKLAKVGRLFQLIGAFTVVSLILAHLAVLMVPGVSDGGEREEWVFYSWLGLLTGLGVAACLFWLGGYLRRVY